MCQLHVHAGMWLTLIHTTLTRKKVGCFTLVYISSLPRPKVLRTFFCTITANGLALKDP